MERRTILFLTVIIASLLLACGRIPDYVIDPDEMEDLLVDIHKAEAYMESNKYIAHNKAAQDSIKNNIYAKHNVTKAEFDSSMIWYGANLKEYIEIYDNVINRLQNEDNKLLAMISDQPDMYTGLTRSGDTVNIWNKSPHFIFEGKLNNNLLTFLVPYDDNFKDNDIFKLKFKISSQYESRYPTQVILAVKESKNATNYIKKEIKSLGWDSLELKTKGSIRRVIGSIYVPADPIWRTTNIDSISLERIHTK